MSQPLIYDVGMHNGDDTAYYLQAGYRVLAIEANPLMAERARQRFAAPIADGRLTLLGVGIARDVGSAEFWVCDDVSVWSSFDRRIASRDGSRHHPVQVECRTFESILAEFGTAHYCKIDIEGNDHLCLEALIEARPPRYLSIEMSDEHGDRDLAALWALGYRRFKIIDQTTFQPPSALLQQASRVAPQALRPLRGLHRRLRARRRDGRWRFPEGSSGPFGEHTSGPWIEYHRAVNQWRRLRALDPKLHAQGLFGWHDIHATA
jgi:FkbM family methyltransferase